jgi:hypothetical protein
MQVLSKLARWIGGLIATLVTLSALFSYWPLLTVNFGNLLDPTDPFSSPALITNDSVLPLFHISASCSFNDGEDLNGNTFRGDSIILRNVIPLLTPHRTTTVQCFRMMHFPHTSLKKGTATITVYY